MTSGALFLGGVIVCISDRRLKCDIRTCDGLPVDRLRVVRFKRREHLTHGRGDHLGLIAQEVEAVLPEAVHKYRGTDPNIYKWCELISADEDTIVVSAECSDEQVRCGDRVSYGVESSTFQAQVIHKSASHICLRVQEASCKAAKGIWLIGKVVEDMRHIDYNQVSVATLAAVQQYRRENDELLQRVELLERKLEQLLSR